MTQLIVSPQAQLSDSQNVYQALDDWLAFLEKQVKAGEITHDTSNTYRQGVRKFIGWVENRKEVSEDIVLSWKAEMQEKYSHNTISTWLAGVKAFFDWGVRRHYFPYNPVAGIKGPKRSRKGRHLRDRLTDDEVLSVLNAASQHEDAESTRDRAMLYLIAYTGAREVEVHRADYQSLSMKGEHWVLRVQGKGRRDEDDVLVIANPTAQAALADWINVRGKKAGPLFQSLSNRSLRKRLSTRSIREIGRKYYLIAGINDPRKTLHSLRHAAISSAIAHHAPLHKAQSMARHSNPATTMIYVHEDDRITDPAEARIDYGTNSH